MRSDRTFLCLRRGFLFLAFCMMLSCAMPVFADVETPATEETEVKTTEPATETETTKVKTPKNANKWKKKNGYWFYYNEKGKKSKGLTKIGKKTYLFDKKGRQLHGWQKVDNSYYYFYLSPKKKGYMAKKTTINGIYLKKNGKAKVSSGSYLLYCLMESSKIVESCTKPTMSTSAKMRAAWNYMQSRFDYYDVKYNYSSSWAINYGYQCFYARGGSCEGLGIVWAFLANACGAKNCYAVCSGGHGWAVVNGLYYDPARARYEPYRSATGFYGASDDSTGWTILSKWWTYKV